MVGTSYKDHWLTPIEAGVVVVGSLVGFAVIWFILYIQTRDDLTDIYSIVRKQIAGTWQVKYATSPNYGDVKDRIVNCDIQEDTVRKLEMRFSIVQNPLFSPQGPNVVKDIALRMTKTGYKMFYYFETERVLADDIVTLLPVDDPNRRGIQIETLGMVEFDRPLKKTDKVQLMTGKWYYLNGNMMRLMKLLELADHAKLLNQPFTPIAFNDVPVSQIHFDADMGSITFAYQGQK
ncbi:hypothetical protein SSBR45G_19510 [Bradyrhizobium sp. SSBR45G]|uniref:hypothetical protein n=1 Tax=unclassified Bradyrhizobium TaxID=2631580 RepID=UPI002342B5A0|nr:MULTISPECIES: hypothetical protein [unclassified Bradyrhizobium]GLH77043.1 hypothetical protein SSBR45G_19510 [Bradyrhizobium sp. SSBR45G]GLH83801.1 hypothetical protein SSBR45R_12610 [Bradyrhizobium sp. SSBR45R]